MRLYLYITILCLLVSVSARAQRTDYEAGYIVTNSDTIRGLLLRTNEVKLGKEVKFKSSEASKVTTYIPAEIKSFSFDKDGFIFQTVELALRKDTILNKTNRFAKLLLSGYTSLYKLQLEDYELTAILEYNNDWVYILRKNNTFYTLGQFESEIDPQQYKFDKRYIPLLKSLTSDCSSIKVNQSLRFEDSKIIEVVKSYNDCMEPNSSKSFSHKVKLIKKHGISVSYGSLVNFYYVKSFSNSNAPSIGYFWDITNPSRSKNISLLTGINYMHLSYSLPAPNNKTIKIKEHYLKLPLIGQRNFYSKRNAVPFLNFGITLQANADYGFNYVDIVPFVDLGAGVYINKLRLSLLLENPGLAFKSDKILSLGVGYRLDRLK